MRRFTGLCMACAVVGLLATAARAQRAEGFFQRSLFFERDTRERLEAVTPPEQKTLIEWGGFYIPSYTYFTDMGGHNGNMTFQDLRLWTQIRVDDVHRIYARMRLDYMDFAAGDAPPTMRSHDLIGPNLEMGFYEVDISRAVEKYGGGGQWPVRVTARGGRQYIEVGRGIALARILDAGLFLVESKDFAFKGFAGRTEPGEDNIDLLAPNFTNSRRNFYGGEFRYRGIERHEPYAFFVIQRDWSQEKPDNPFQDFRYDSQYYGIGSRGALTKDLRYEVESLWEFGRSYASLQEEGPEPIRAYAFDAEVGYYVPNQAAKPVLSAEYAYASGDQNRRSAISALGGNRIGTPDRLFQGFGFVNSGLALASRFSNLQFVRLGGRVTPYEDKARFGRLDVGVDYYFQFKASAEGAMSDTRAGRDSANVGQEVDVFMEWRILSDLAISVRYARFFPGRAYSDRDPRDFLYTALNFSF
jgi:hypothetical protein